MTQHLSALRARFERAARSVGARGDLGSVFDDLLVRYGEEQRHYHTLAHVDACLRWLDRYHELAQHEEEVELALWFHDVIYDPRRDDNERRSAALAEDALGALSVPRATRERVRHSIEATATHDASGRDDALVIDLDLAILAAPAEAFARFEEQIRREYAHVPSALYRVGRRRVLQRFLSRPRVYTLPEIGAAFEQRARANLQRRVDELSAWR